MALTIADLVTPLTPEQVRTSIYQVLGVVGVNTTTWKPGAVVRTIIFAVAIVLAWLSTLIAGLASSAFLTYARGGWLTLTARYVYGVERELATFATGEVTLENTGGGIYSVDAGDLTLSNPDTGKTYRNTEAFELEGGETLVIGIVAVEAGSASSAVAGGISVLETPLIGVECTNAAALVGRDDEEDQALKNRCLEKLGSVSPLGPWDAYSFAAKNSKRADGTSIGVTRTKPVPDGYGGLTLYVATASGGVTGSVGSPTSDLGIIFLAIQQVATPLCVTSTAVSATTVLIAVDYDLWVYDSISLTDSEINDQVALALAKHIATLSIGGNASGEVSHALLERTIASVFTDDTFDARVNTPSGSPALDNEEVPALGAVTFTIHREPRPLGA